MKDLRKTLTIGTTCGRCVSGVKSLLKESLAGVDNTMTCKLTNNNIIHAPV